MAGTLVSSAWGGKRALAEVEIGNEKIFSRGREALASQTNASLLHVGREPLRNGLAKDKLF